MSAEQDISLDEKRVYGAKTGEREAFVATAAGLVRVAVSDALVGEFGLAWRGDARDVSAGDHLVVATDGDVLVAVAGEEGTDDIAFEATGFGPAVAVSAHGGVFASDGERVAELTDDGWVDRCGLGDVRAVDGRMVAAASGVHRLDGSHVGLSDARDVATRGVPLAATGDGLFALGNGWMRALDAPCEVVASDGERAHAATADRLYEREDHDGGWTAVDLPAGGRVVGVDYGGTTYAVTADGTLLAYDPAESAWRDRTLGLPDARAIAVTGTDD